MAHAREIAVLVACCAFAQGAAMDCGGSNNSSCGETGRMLNRLKSGWSRATVRIALAEKHEFAETNTGAGYKKYSDGICAGTDTQYSLNELRASSQPYNWYTHQGLATGICDIKNVKRCAEICSQVDGCAFFSISLRQACYACFVHKTCDAPNKGYDYTVYKMTTREDIHQKYGNGICAGTDGEYTVTQLRASDQPYNWYTHPGLATGICDIKDVNKCAEICRGVEGCAFFSISLRQPCFACFVHKTCQAPNNGYDYTIYKMMLAPPPPPPSQNCEPAHTYYANGICKGTDAEYSLDELRASDQPYSWYTHQGLANGICDIKDVKTCAEICRKVPQCAFFSISLRQPCYACFVHKTCNEQDTSNDYTVYQMSPQMQTIKVA